MSFLEPILIPSPIIICWPCAVGAWARSNHQRFVLIWTIRVEFFRKLFGREVGAFWVSYASSIRTKIPNSEEVRTFDPIALFESVHFIVCPCRCRCQCQDFRLATFTKVLHLKWCITVDDMTITSLFSITNGFLNESPNTKFFYENRRKK